MTLILLQFNVYELKNEKNEIETNLINIHSGYGELL